MTGVGDLEKASNNTEVMVPGNDSDAKEIHRSLNSSPSLTNDPMLEERVVPD